MITDRDLDLLERWLDGELDLADQEQLQQRLQTDPELSRELGDLRAHRSLREGFFSALEGDAALPDRLLAALHERSRSRQAFAGRMRIFRFASAAAACIAIGFLAGYTARISRHPASSPDHVVAQTPDYEVSLTDDAGHIVAVQKFSTPDQARAFSEDFQLSQERLTQLRSGQITIRSEQF